jgi:hypothetical protein
MSELRKPSHNSVIIGGARHTGRTTLLNKLLVETSLSYRFGLRAISFRPENYIAQLEDEVVFNAKKVNKQLYDDVVRMRPELIAFDTRYEVDTFSKGWSPHLLGYTVFYVVDAEGDTIKELKDSTVENFLKITGENKVTGFNKIMVTSVDDLDVEFPFNVTEFLLPQNKNFYFNQITEVYDYDD